MRSQPATTTNTSKPMSVVPNCCSLSSISKRSFSCAYLTYIAETKPVSYHRSQKIFSFCGVIQI